MRQSINTTITVLCLVFFVQSIYAQIGLRTKYFSNNFDSEYEKEINSTNNSDLELISSGFGIGLDYWFRLKDKRIEFLPEIEFGKYNTSGDEMTSPISNYGLTKLGFNLNTRIYPLDFGGDCDCPTFSNESTLIKKGFYLELSPGIALNQTKFEFGNSDLDLLYLDYKVGIGTGLDIGLSNLITLNPYAMYNFHFNKSSDTTFLGIQNGYSSYTQLELGLRFAVRFDAKKY